MRLNGDIGEEEGKKVAECLNTQAYSISGGFSQPQSQKLVVGYALTSKKKKSFLQPKLLCLARNKGIFFVPIDLKRPLSDQGPFDVVLHKLSGKDWCEVIEKKEKRRSHKLFRVCLILFKQCVSLFNPRRSYLQVVNSIIKSLVEYRQKHPEVAVLDPPDGIQHLHNRQSMLQDVADLNLSDCHGKVGVPRQLVITKDPSSIPYEVTKSGLKLPLVAKPLVVDGSAKSHELSLAYDQLSLTELEPPLVLQEFVNHGAILFKVYIVGETIKVVRRFSLPNVSKCELAKVSGVYRFPRVSSASASADDADLEPGVAEHPPRPLLEKLARELRRRLGLRLFNIDMIREHGTRDVFYVIDINYFPGYGKMPDYEHIFTDFLLSLVQSKYKKRPTT